MNKKIKEIVAGVTVVGIVIAGYSFSCDYECHYNLTAIVVDVNSTQQTVTLKDKSNNEWIMEEVTNLTNGDKVKMKMYTNLTDSIYDDVIEEYKVVK